MGPLLQAEQAVLGAVLLDPGQLAHLDWLEPDHFYRPVHQALFAALRELRAAGHPSLAAQCTVPLSWVTDSVGEASRTAPGMTLVYAHSLVAACARPGHAPVYGRMVLEGAIHRTVTEHAVRLHQAARTDTLHGEVEGTLHYADALAEVLAGLARRWGSDPQPAAPPVSPDATVGAPSAREDRGTEDERFLLAVLVERPNAMDEVVGWLRPGDFSVPAHAELYRCLGALHHRGEPVDRITVLWEAQRRGLLADRTVTAEEVTEICDGIGPGSAEWLGEQVMRSSVSRAAATSANAIRTLAANETLSPGRLISYALHSLGPLDETRERWRKANGEHTPLPPTEPGPSASARVSAALSRSAPGRSPAPAQAPTPAQAAGRGSGRDRPCPTAAPESLRPIPRGHPQ